MKFYGFIEIIFNCYLYAHTGPFFDILIIGILNISNYMFDLHIILSDSNFVTYQSLQIFDSNKFTINFNVIRIWIAANIEEYAHKVKL